jgi:hypothetical protein
MLKQIDFSKITLRDIQDNAAKKLKIFCALQTLIIVGTSLMNSSNSILLIAASVILSLACLITPSNNRALLHNVISVSLTYKKPSPLSQRH